MRKRAGLLFGIALLLVFWTGCGPKKQVDYGIFQLKVDWEELTPLLTFVKSQAERDQSDREIPTHVAARLIYPANKATFTQMTEKDTASNEGIITMQVPPGTAVLQVIVVHDDIVPEKLAVISGAVKEGINIEQGKTLALKLGDLNLQRFDVEWGADWKEKFDEENVATVTPDDVIENVNGKFIEVTIEYNDPLWSNQIPKNMFKNPMGTFLYQKSDGNWDNDTYWSGGDFNTPKRTGSAHFIVKDDLSGFITKAGDQVTTVKGWLGPYINGEDWNLPWPIPYYFIGTPFQSGPTCFELVWDNQ